MTADLKTARDALAAAIRALDEATTVWSEAVTALHMSEIKLREAQRHMRQSHRAVENVLNGASPE